MPNFATSDNPPQATGCVVAGDGRNFVTKGTRLDKSRIIYNRCSLEAHSIMKRPLAEKGFSLKR